MVAKIQRCIQLNNIPSASGIEIVGNLIFVIGDDSNFLFVLDREFQLLDKIKLYQTNHSHENRIEKHEKFDLEAITEIEVYNNKSLIVLGSGSNAKREIGILIDYSTNSAIQEFSVASLYSEFKKNLRKTTTLNIEGLASDNTYLYFFHRGNISNENAMMRLKISTFCDFVLNQTISNLDFQIYYFELPSINTILSGFSGACSMPSTNKLLFTSSVENTHNEIDDGKSLGSFIGVIDLENNKLEKISRVTYKGGEVFNGKIESIAVLEVRKDSIYALCVTDMDGRVSELLEIKIEG